MFDGVFLGQMRGDASLAGMLTTFGGNPAVFYQSAPPDTAQGWSGTCYPRMDYLIDTQFDPATNTAGVLEVNIFCAVNSEVMPEEIAARVIALTDGTFYTADGETVAAQFQDSRVERIKTQSGTGAVEIFWQGLTFRLMGFPDQRTGHRTDPIEGLNRWTAGLEPYTTTTEREKWTESLVVVGVSAMDAVMQPSREKPIVWWELERLDINHEMGNFALSFYDASFALHVFAGDVTGRNRVTRRILDALPYKVRMRDRVPLTITDARMDTARDPLKQGGLTIKGIFGRVTRREDAAETINEINTEEQTT